MPPVLLRSLLVALLLALGVWQPAAAQGERPAQLSELKRARDRARDAHHDAIVKITLQSQEIRRYGAELTRLTRQVQALRSEPAGVLRDQELKTVRREQNRVSKRLANLRVRVRALESGREIRRLKLIQASWAWVARLLETADRTWRVGRYPQAKQYTDEALEELRRLEDWEALQPPPREGYQPEPLDPSASLEELSELKELYEALADSFSDQARELEPVEARLKSRVKHLDRLVQYSYAVPTLGQRLERARTDLERIAGLRRDAEQRVLHYRKEVEAIDALINDRDLRRQEQEREHGR